MVWLKACRVHCADCLKAIDAAGFQFAGVHAISSVDRRALTHAKELQAVKTRAGLAVELVLLTKTRDPNKIALAMEGTGLTWLQLHASWSKDELVTLKNLLDNRVRILALHDPSHALPEAARELLQVADYLIVDHHQGGTGKRIDTSQLAAIQTEVGMSRVFLSGGLTDENVKEIVTTFDPYAIDVQSFLVGLNGEQDYLRMVNFVAAASGRPRSGRPPAARLPFERYSSQLWDSIDPEAVTREDLVAKFNLIETLEARSPYRLATTPYWSRVEGAINQIADLSSDVRPEWLTAALVVFANVIYLPQEMLVQAWRSLFLDLVEGLSEYGSTTSGLLNRIHLFENDPSGLTSEFCHVNRLEGRLDTQTMGRIEGTDKLSDLLLGLANPQTAKQYQSTLSALMEKADWVLLVDKTLSGHSLKGDLERLMRVAELAQELGYTLPRIWVLAQVASQQATDAIADLQETYGGGFEIRAAMLLTAAQSLSAPGARLIQTPAIRDAARELCTWFGRSVIAKDPALDRMRSRSGDDLEFGYRNCGFILVDHDNCPTGSLPILWYSSPEATYRGPYERVHSRLGNQSVERSRDKWNMVLDDPTLRMAFESLRRADR